MSVDKKMRKEKLKAEAEKLGISYKKLKEQRKAEKENKKRTKEAEKLIDPDHKEDMKRMRTWSQDENDPEAKHLNTNKRRRTRSMDAKEEQETQTAQKADMSPAEWRKDQHISIKGHGKYTGKGEETFPDPFLKFTDAPFSPNVLRSFDQAGFTSPTSIQSQVGLCVLHFTKKNRLHLNALLTLFSHNIY